MGKKLANIIITIFDNSPIPNQSIIIGTRANGGTCLINSNRFLKYSYNLGFIPNTIPRGRAKNIDIPKPIITLLKLIAMLFSNFPFFARITKLFITFSGDGIIKLFHNLKIEPKYYVGVLFVNVYSSETFKI